MRSRPFSKLVFIYISNPEKVLLAKAENGGSEQREELVERILLKNIF